MIGFPFSLKNPRGIAIDVADKRRYFAWLTFNVKVSNEYSAVRSSSSKKLFHPGKKNNTVDRYLFLYLWEMVKDVQCRMKYDALLFCLTKKHKKSKGKKTKFYVTFCSISNIL